MEISAPHLNVGTLPYPESKAFWRNLPSLRAKLAISENRQTKLFEEQKILMKMIQIQILKIAQDIFEKHVCSPTLCNFLEIDHFFQKWHFF